MNTTIVKFVKCCDKYIKGDVAGFSNSDPFLKAILKDGTAIFLSEANIDKTDPPIQKGWEKRLPEKADPIKIICPICGETQKSKSELKRHKVTVHGIK